MIEQFGFERISLDETNCFYQGRIPDDLDLSDEQFEELWTLHPDEYHEIKMHGRLVKTPRWQQAYGADYFYTGRVNRALPVPDLLVPILEWSQKCVNERMNAILLNWYDAEHKHYIGKHRDNWRDMIDDTPIITISFGDARMFRLRPWGKTKTPSTPNYRDFEAANGTMFVMPYNTNLAYTHEVPHSAKSRGRRISVTIRAFS